VTCPKNKASDDFLEMEGMNGRDKEMVDATRENRGRIGVSSFEKRGWC